MSYETSSEFQIRYLLKSVAVYLLFMRRIASISMLAVVSALSASAATVLFDFNSSLLPETPAKAVSVTDSGSGFVATLATASSSANLGSGLLPPLLGTGFPPELLLIHRDWALSWKTRFLSETLGRPLSPAPKDTSLSLTISGLVAGALQPDCPCYRVSV